MASSDRRAKDKGGWRQSRSAARVLPTVQGSEAPARGVEAVLLSLDETEKRDNGGDWVEEVGRNLFFNSRVKGRPVGGGEG